MATKKTNSKSPAKEQKRSTPNISARIDRLVDYENSKVKAVASVNIGGAFAIHGIRVIDSQKGLFVQMPQNSLRRSVRPRGGIRLTAPSWSRKIQ